MYVIGSAQSSAQSGEFAVYFSVVRSPSTDAMWKSSVDIECAQTISAMFATTPIIRGTPTSGDEITVVVSG